MKTKTKNIILGLISSIALIFLMIPFWLHAPLKSSDAAGKPVFTFHSTLTSMKPSDRNKEFIVYGEITNNSLPLYGVQFRFDVDNEVFKIGDWLSPSQVAAEIGTTAKDYNSYEIPDECDKVNVNKKYVTLSIDNNGNPINDSSFIVGGYKMKLLDEFDFSSVSSSTINLNQDEGNFYVLSAETFDAIEVDIQGASIPISFGASNKGEITGSPTVGDKAITLTDGKYVSDTFPYPTTSINVDDIIIPVSPGATIEFYLPSGTKIPSGGAISLNEGDNNVTVKVIAENGTPYEYTFVFPRAAGKEINSLNALKLDISGGANLVSKTAADLTSGGTITVSDHIKYNDKNKLSLSVQQINNSESTSEVFFNNTKISTITDYTLKTLALSGVVEGANEIKIVVTPQKTGVSASTYIINFNLEAGETENRLDTLVIKKLDGTILALNKAFNPDDASYTVTVPKDVSKVKVEATAKGTYSTVTGTGEKTASGNLQVIVTPQKGTAKTYTITVNKEKETENRLQTLVIKNTSGATIALDRTFDPDVDTYTINVPYATASVIVQATAKGNFATITGTGNQSISAPLKVIVTSESGVSKTYTINVVRDAAETEARLQSLTIKNGDTVITLDKTFDPDTETYSITVPYALSSVMVEAIAMGKFATVTGTGSHSTNSNIQVVVTAQNNVKKTYTVTINRVRETETRLQTLVIKNTSGDVISLTPSFDPDTENYSISVPYGTTTVKVEATAKGSYASITGLGNQNISTSIKVKVTAQNGDTKNYTITVNAGQDSEKRLQTLVVKDLSGNVISFDKPFNQDTENYTMTVPAEMTTVKVEASAKSSNATINGTGVQSVDAPINVVVTAQDGSSKTYTITIIKQQAESENRLASLVVKDTNGNVIPLDKTFNPDVENYSITVPFGTKNVNIEATAKGAYATIVGIGTKPVNDPLQVKVTAQNGDIKIYTVTVNVQPEDPDIPPVTPEELTDMAAYAVTPNGQEYEVKIRGTLRERNFRISIPYMMEIDHFIIKAGLASSEYVVEGLNHKYPISEGQKLDHYVYFVKDGKVDNELTLKFEILYQSNNNSLLSLTVGEDSLTLDKYDFVYKVGKNINDILVKAVASDVNAEVTIGFSDIKADISASEKVINLKSGENVVYIRVKATSGDYLTYTVTIIKAGSAQSDFPVWAYILLGAILIIIICSSVAYGTIISRLNKMKTY